MYLKELGKEQTKLKAYRRREITKVRAEINELIIDLKDYRKDH